MNRKSYLSSAVSGACVGVIFHSWDSLYYNLIVHHRFPRLLTKGILYSTLSGIIKVCSLFPTQEFIKQQINWMDLHSQNSISGMLTGIVVAFVATPLNSIKVQLLTTKHNIFTIIDNIHKKNGLSGFNKGLGFTICRDVSGYGTYFCLFPIFMSRMILSIPVGHCTYLWMQYFFN